MKKNIAKWYKERGITIACTVRKTDGSVCECGQKLTYETTPFISLERRVCPKCGRLHWVKEY